MLGIGLAIGLTRRAAAGEVSMLARSLATSPGTIIALYPFDDPSGSTARDASPTARDAGYVGTYTLGVPGVQAPDVAVGFTGSGSGYVQLPAAVRAAFNGAAGTISAWVRVTDASVWDDGVNGYIAVMRADTTNQVRIFKPSSPTNQITFSYVAGGTTETIAATGISTTDWLHIALTWDKAAEECKAFLNGEQVGSTATALGTFTGAISASFSEFASGAASAATAWDGRMALARLDNAALTPAQIATLATI